MLGFCSLLVILLVVIKTHFLPCMHYLIVLSPYIFFVGFNALYWMLVNFVKNKRRREWFEGAELYDKPKN